MNAGRPISPQPTLSGVRVLVVEDDQTNRIVAKALLERFGCDVDFAENGQVAVDKVKGQSFDVIIMDCMMPIMDGFQATTAIREWESGNQQQVPIIAFTALSGPEDQAHCYKVGMNDFMSKPARAEVFREKLEHWAQSNNQTVQT